MQFKFTFVLIALLISPTSSAAVISVSGDYASIQAAIDNASPGDVIEVESGVSRENVDVNKPLTLRGLGMPTIDAGGKGSAITLSADGVTLDGFVATNSGGKWMDAGIKVASKENIIVSNNASRNNRDGIYLCSASNNTIFGNNATDNSRYGINIEKSSNSNMRENLMSRNRYNFGGTGHNDIDTSNLVDGKTIYYLVGAYDKVFNSTSNAGMVYCIDCENITVSGLKFKNNQHGIYFYNTSISIIENNTVINNSVGISMEYSDDNTITANNASYNFDGIELVHSDNNTISHNYASYNNETGIFLYSSSKNTVMGNNPTGNVASGILLGESTNNTIVSNNASNNNADGISLYSSYNNSIESNTVSGNRSSGITLYSSGNNKIENNYAISNKYGISFFDSFNNTMKDNLMSSNRYNFGADGYNDIDTSNLVDGNPVYYLVGVLDLMIDSSSGSGIVYCIDCDNITVRGLTLKNNVYGVSFDNTSNSRIENINARDNHYYGIHIQNSSNNILKGNKACSNIIDGIRLTSSSNNTLKGNNATDNKYGIRLTSSGNNTLEGNNASRNNNTGMWLYSSIKNKLKYNQMFGNLYNFGADGYNDIDTSNLVDGKPVYYLVSASNTAINSSSDAGLVCCIDCENITVSGLMLKNNRYGIHFDGTCNSRIENNNATGNIECGIYLQSSSNNAIVGNNACYNELGGIALYNSDNNSIMGNNASYNEVAGTALQNSNNNSISHNNFGFNKLAGIELLDSNNNAITDNIVSHNEQGGVVLSGSCYNIIRDNNACYNGYGIGTEGSSSNNTISENNASYNELAGIGFLESQDNVIYHNTLVNNLMGNTADSGTNQWDDGAAGNYYSDFNCTDSDGDGICDSVCRIIGGESVDRYPLAAPPT